MRIAPDAHDFIVTDGLTVEALFISRWSGAPLDYDEFFRKQSEGESIVFSFQNDNRDRVNGPVLAIETSFASGGLNFDMPLDGQEGRPSLAELTDGKMHHVVATLNRAAREATIYVDGTKRMAMALPANWRFAIAPLAPAMIGNMPGTLTEPFTGVLDEVAIYRSALSAEDVALHWQRAQQGNSYFHDSDAAAR